MMKSKILWKSNQIQKDNSNLFKFEKFVSFKYKLKINQNYQKLLKWSINNPKEFWSSIWDFSKVKGLKKNNLEKSNIFFKNKFLKNSKLNFAENLLSKNDNSKAITFISENGTKKIRTWRDLNKNVHKLITFFKFIKLKEKDRVVAYVPNLIETVEAFAATSALGLIWSSCSPDFGVSGVIERFSQIKPKVLIICDKYYYNGNEINVLERLPFILNKIKSIKHVIIINYPGKKYLKINNLNIKYTKWNSIMKINPSIEKFKKFDFDHELVILYSSGTTGKPKCICHRSGGVLLQHIKEHQLHNEIKPNDNVFYFTTCGWMMWNWLVTALASKASIVLFDGAPMYKKNDLLIKIAYTEKITLFGVSAKYIDELNKSNTLNKKKYNLKFLRTICSTGSPLSEESFRFIYKKVKSNVHLASISGGTDIVSCFVLGNIYEPVIEGHIQNKGLGMDVDIFDDNGKAIKNKKGELVCKNAFPTIPLKFWNDKKDLKFRDTYFNKFKNIWHHGDFAELKSSGGFVIYGRSDTTLNPGGVRLGTSEIYSEVDKFKEIKESLVIGQSWKNDIRIILFVIIKENYELNEDLIKKIKMQIKKNVSPRHAPSKIIKIKDIPKTKNGKIVELTVKNIIEGSKIKNKEALANPEALDQFKNLKELKY